LGGSVRQVKLERSIRSAEVRLAGVVIRFNGGVSARAIRDGVSFTGCKRSCFAGAEELLAGCCARLLTVKVGVFLHTAGSLADIRTDGASFGGITVSGVALWGGGAIWADLRSDDVTLLIVASDVLAKAIDTGRTSVCGDLVTGLGVASVCFTLGVAVGIVGGNSL